LVTNYEELLLNYFKFQFILDVIPAITLLIYSTAVF